MKENREKRSRGVWKVGAAAVLLLVGLCFFCHQRNLGPWSNKGISHPHVEDSRSIQQVQADFEALTQQIFVNEVTQDSITLNFQLKSPEKYGISAQEPSLGSYSLTDRQDDLALGENWLAQLQGFDYDKLTEEQQLIYDLLVYVLSINQEASSFLEYEEPLGPTSGIQAQLPILLANFHFRTEEDITTYLEILSLIPDYFDEIIAWEGLKSKDGLFMSDTTAQAIVDQCQTFIASPEDNYLIEVFNNKVKEYRDGKGSSFSASRQKSLCKQNKTAVLNQVIPAYAKLITSLEDLKGSAKTQGGLSNLKQGKEYYTWLVRQQTGSERSLEEIAKMLDEAISSAQKDLSNEMTEDPNAYYDAQNVQYPTIEPEETLRYLEEKIVPDFPALPKEIHWDLQYVDESLEDSISPAFYLTAPMDDYQNNAIYINQNDKYSLRQAFATVAHEGYPGHMYQNAYFQSTSPAPIRSMINIKGYSEGWGTYAELYSYSIAGLQDGVRDILQDNTIATLCLYAKADLCVNGQGWSEKRLNKYLKEYGFDQEQVQTIYNSMVAEPCSYMPYALGYLEICELQEQAKKEMGKAYSLKAFHEFFLEQGNLPFSILADRLHKLG